MLQQWPTTLVTKGYIIAAHRPLLGQNIPWHVGWRDARLQRVMHEMLDVFESLQTEWCFTKTTSHATGSNTPQYLWGRGLRVGFWSINLHDRFLGLGSCSAQPLSLDLKCLRCVSTKLCGLICNQAMLYKWFFLVGAASRQESQQPTDHISKLIPLF